jgi:hypothetical protein
MYSEDPSFLEYFKKMSAAANTTNSKKKKTYEPLNQASLVIPVLFLSSQGVQIPIKKLASDKINLEINLN